MTKRAACFALGLVLALVAAACDAAPTATEAPAERTAVPSPAATATTVATATARATATASATATVAPTATGEPLASLLVPEFNVGEPEIVYTQPERVARGLTYWPDGNIGFWPAGEGAFAFFAANSIRTARTVGTLDDPAREVGDSALAIQGIGAEYDYSAGGPVYEDAGTGLLLMLYHAERHLDSSGSAFYSEIGMAASDDGGQTFSDLGIILAPNAPPSDSTTAEMAGGTYAVADGFLYVYFRDVLASGQHVNLALARTPLDEVISAATAGDAAEFQKYYQGAFSEPGVGGRSTALETGNPLNRWMSVSYNDTLEQFLMVVAETTQDRRTLLHLIASADGVTWSPRVSLLERPAELFYPSIIGTEGSPLRTGETFYVYYTASENWENRWADARLERVAVTVSGALVELPHRWEFESAGDAEGWTPQNQIAGFEVADGALVVEPAGNDPYLLSPFLGLSTDAYRAVEIRMKTEAAGWAQLFFTSSAAPGISESSSKRFEIVGDGAFHTYTVEMAGVHGWQGHLGQLRFDPTDQTAPVAIDFIRLLP